MPNLKRFDHVKVSVRIKSLDFVKKVKHMSNTMNKAVNNHLKLPSLYEAKPAGELP